MAGTLKDFLNGKVATNFEPRPYYCPDGDFLTFYMKDEECYAQRVDEHLTVYKSTETDELVGCKIKGVLDLIKSLQNFGFTLTPEGNSIGLNLLFVSAAGGRKPEALEYYEAFGRYTKDVPFPDLQFA